MQLKLTRRQKEILTQLLDGAVPKEIASKLNISYDTVVTHQKNLYRKLNVHSIEELLEKQGKTAAVSNAPAVNEPPAASTKQSLLNPKILIPAAITAVFIISFFIILIYNLAKRREDTEIFSNPDRIYLEDGTYFTGRTFDNIYLYANRWENIEGKFYGEQYFSHEQIWLSDIYSGTFNELMRSADFIRLRISGTVDKECKNMMAMIHYVYEGSWYYEYDGRWYTAFAHSGGRRISIGPGDFSEIFVLKREAYHTLPEGGYFIICIFNTLITVNNNWIDDIGERIPDDMPNGTRWAVINNLKIEPLDRLARQ